MFQLILWIKALQIALRLVRGHWLRPWESPYLRWRIETYAGIPAHEVSRPIFLKFLRENWRELLAYLKWAAWMELATKKLH